MKAIGLWARRLKWCRAPPEATNQPLLFVSLAKISGSTSHLNSYNFLLPIALSLVTSRSHCMNRKSARHLIKADPVMAKLVARVGPLDFLPRRLPPFQSLVHAIILQQFSGKA